MAKAKQSDAPVEGPVETASQVEEIVPLENGGDTAHNMSVTKVIREARQKSSVELLTNKVRKLKRQLRTKG